MNTAKLSKAFHDSFSDIIHVKELKVTSNGNLMIYPDSVETKKLILNNEKSDSKKIIGKRQNARIDGIYMRFSKWYTLPMW